MINQRFGKQYAIITFQICFFINLYNIRRLITFSSYYIVSTKVLIIYSIYTYFSMYKQVSAFRNEQKYSSPLYNDTQFIASDFHYIIIHNSKISPNPIVTPIEDQATTFHEIQQDISKLCGVESKIKKKGGLEVVGKITIEEYKFMESKKNINGQEFYTGDLPIQSSSSVNRNSVNRNSVSNQNYEKYQICCVMLNNQENVFHLQFRMDKDLSIQALILMQINNNLQKKLSLEEIKMYGLETSYHIIQKKEISFSFQPKKIKNLKQYMVSHQNLVYIGVEITQSSSKFDSNRNQRRPNQIIPVTNNFIGIQISNNLRLINYDSIAKYPIKFILGILKIPNPEGKGLKILNKIYSPNQTLADLAKIYTNFTKINFLEAVIVEQYQLLFNDLKSQHESMSKKQLQSLAQSDSSYRSVIQSQKLKKQELSSLNVYNSLFKIDNRYQQNIYFYRLINQFTNNYYTHNVGFYESSVRSRYILSMYEEMSNLKSYDGYCYRKVSYLTKYKENDILTFKNFIMASKNQTQAFSMKIGNGKNETLFKIKSIKGKQIQNQSYFPNLQEIIFLPYTKFKIIKKQQIKGQTLFQLQQINQEIIPNHCNILVWLDHQGKQKQGLTIVNHFKDASNSIIFKQFHSNQSFEQWITQNFSLLKQNHKTIVITNMVRIEKGIENKNAGVQTIKLANKKIMNICTIAYVGYIDFAIQKLKENNIDPQTVHVVNQSQSLITIILKFFDVACKMNVKQMQVSKKLEVVKKVEEKVKIEEKVKKQDWQDFFSNITVTNGGKIEQKTPIKVDDVQNNQKLLPKEVKIEKAPSKILNLFNLPISQIKEKPQIVQFDNNQINPLFINSKQSLIKFGNTFQSKFNGNQQLGTQSLLSKSKSSILPFYKEYQKNGNAKN